MKKLKINIDINKKLKININRRKGQFTTASRLNMAIDASRKATVILVRCLSRFGVLVMVVVIALWTFYSVARGYPHLSENRLHEETQKKLLLPFMKHKDWVSEDELKSPDELFAEWQLSEAFNDLLSRSQRNRKSCTSLQSSSEFKGFDLSYEVPFENETVASLPSFGIIERLERFQDDPIGALSGSEEDPKDWQCSLPPQTECQETKLTVVLMAYNPDRLKKTFGQVKTMLTDVDWKTLVEEVVLVWNGVRSLEESRLGKEMLVFAKTESLRVVYPLRIGLENDLMNRYHPKVLGLSTKAILYYDDDGPFYSFPAVQGGFELWKRHSSSQIGAMAREITFGSRQTREHSDLLGDQHANDSQFVSHCTNVNDKVDYNYRYFANYDANIVLPSGSMLHSNYLCFLWHPVLEPIRDFVRKHPVHPDDVTVSMIVSQLGGKAPRVYSRRLVADDSNKSLKTIKRRLSGGLEFDNGNERLSPATLQHRRLLFDINWDAKGGMDQKKKFWAALRTEAINALVQYFGSINSGSIGWCENSPYYNEKVDGRCKPAMARIGWLPWMNVDGTPKETCP